MANRGSIPAVTFLTSASVGIAAVGGVIFSVIASYALNDAFYYWENDSRISTIGKYKQALHSVESQNRQASSIISQVLEIESGDKSGRYAFESLFTVERGVDVDSVFVISDQGVVFSSQGGGQGERKGIESNIKSLGQSKTFTATDCSSTAAGMNQCHIGYYKKLTGSQSDRWLVTTTNISRISKNLFVEGGVFSSVVLSDTSSNNDILIDDTYMPAIIKAVSASAGQSLYEKGYSETIAQGYGLEVLHLPGAEIGSPKPALVIYQDTNHISFIKDELTRNALYFILLASAAIFLVSYTLGRMVAKKLNVYLKVLEPLETMAENNASVKGLLKEHSRIAELNVINDILRRLYLRVKMYSEDMQSNADALFYLSTKDELTGLPNRADLNSRFNQLRMLEEVVLINLDVRNFSFINEAVGHVGGDIFLREVAARLSTLSLMYYFSRWSCDEFVCVASGVKNCKSLIDVMDEIKDTLELPIKIEDQEYVAEFYAGVTFINNDSTLEHSLKEADFALKKAKKNSSLPFVIYDDACRYERETTQYTVYQVGKGLDSDEFELYLQPKVSSIKNRVVGYEALLRWNHPEKGVLPPFFLSQMSFTVELVKLNRWVIKEGMRIGAIFKNKGLVLPISINISADILISEGIMHYIIRETELAGVDPELIEFEITEDSLATRKDSLDAIKKLKLAGYRVAIDDFGAGNSNLGYFNQLPMDTIKIDRHFVDHIDEDQIKIAMVSFVYNLANALEVGVVAEGAERIEEVELLASIGIDVIQGFYYSRPIPVDDAIAWQIDFEAKEKVKENDAGLVLL